MKLAPVLFAMAGCVPYSAAVGQTAAPLPTGGTEVGATIGVGYQNVDAEEADPEDESTTFTSLPKVEANVLHGLTDTLGVNIHASEAGLQPGLKISPKTSGNVNIAILPSIAYGTSRYSEGDGGASLSNFQIGARFLASMPDSVYGAIGYDFQRIDQEQDDPDEEGSAVLTFHDLTGAIGFDLAMGGARIRPELAFLFALAGESENPDDPDPGADLNRFAIYPNLTIAVATP
jgi:hypothetical protein